MAGIKPQGCSSGASVDTERDFSGDRYKDMTELVKEREALVSKIQTIDTGLSNRNVTNQNGRRIGSNKYQVTRHELIKDKFNFNKRITEINKIIKQKNIKTEELRLKRQKEKKITAEQKREEIMNEYKNKEDVLYYFDEELGRIIRDTMELQKTIRCLLGR